MNPVVTNHYSEYMIMQHQHMASGMEQRQVENQIQVEVHRMQQQQQQHEQKLVPQPPLQQQNYVPPYQGPGMNPVAPDGPLNNANWSFYMGGNPQHIAGNTPKNNAGKWQNNSPTHLKHVPQSSSSMIPSGASGAIAPQAKVFLNDNSTKNKSPVKVC